MALADARNKFLFELRPDLFPCGFVSQTELKLWEIYYEFKEQSKGRY